MRILITGNLGFIGTYLTKSLKSHTITGIDLKDKKNILDIDFPEVDLVYHLASQSKVIDSINEPVRDAINNIIGTIKVAQAYPNTRIIYSASGGTSLDIKSPYGLSKHIGGEYIKLLCNDYVICNLPNVFNKDDGRVLTNWLASDKITIFGNGEQTRDFVHIEDIVEALIKAQKWETGEYYLGSAKGTKLIDVAKAINKEIIFKPARKGECLNSVVPNTTPDWKPTLSIIDYVCKIK
jgi:UDP-glucose 4-epimerase